MALHTEERTGDGTAGDGSTDAKLAALAARRRTGPLTVAKRYAPFVAMVVAIAAVVVVFGGDGGDDGDAGTVAAEVASTDELVMSGPMTWQRAEAEGRTQEVEWGPDCDTSTGRIRIPIILVPQCVEPFTGDNGGATYRGVTEDEVLIVYYQSNPEVDPIGASMVSATGADVNPASAAEAINDFTDVYNSVFETYGRRVRVETYLGTGASDDREAARADAIAIAEREPFAVLGAPLQSGPAFAVEIASRGIVCGPLCASTMPEEIVDEYYPYMWQVGPTPDQAAALAAEMIGKLARPGPAELAGDPAMQTEERRYALVHYDTAEGDHQAVYEALRDQLAENGVELTIDVPYQLDIAAMQEDARTIISRLEQNDITTVIFYGDPLMPGTLTLEATAQDYHPEWILGPSYLGDTTIFARRTDGEQWRHGFGMSFSAARADRSTIDAFQVYEWAYGRPPDNNTVSVIESPIRTIFTGIHLAGPDLTPETLRDGFYRAEPAGGTPMTAHVSRGDHGIWPEQDNGGSDDATIVWWDPAATGEDETGNAGTGMYRFANGGQRYRLGEFPETAEEAGLFDVESSVTVYDHVPPEDQVPDYPPPEIEPAPAD